MDLRKATAAELGRAIDAGRIDPVDLARMFLDAIDEEDGDRQIYARTTRERALTESEAARQRARAGTRRSPLDGVPVSWKDLFDTAGTATESGSQLLAGRVPERDCEVIRLAEAAGLVGLGKTHQTELAFSGLGINPMTATPPNRAMPGHVPGGSSSGAAASLTHGLAPLAIGSDTGGSVRIPACWNNLVGLKTTHGVISNEGVVPLCHRFDTVGPLARGVEDAALAFAVLSGANVAPPEPADLSSLRIFVPETIVLNDCDGVVVAAFEDAMDVLAAGGAKIRRGPAAEFGPLVELGVKLFPFEAWRNWGPTIEERGELMYEPIRRRFEQGRKVSEADYRAAWAEMERLRGAFFAVHGETDAIAWPTLAILPPKVEALMADVERFAAANLATLRNTRFVNLLGSCALTLPLPATAVGLQLVGRPRGEPELLAIGAAVERRLS